MLCRGCRKYRNRLYYSFCTGATDAGKKGCDVDCVLPGVWHRWHIDYYPSYYVTREPGAGTPQACVSADGQRAGNESRGGEPAVYGFAVGGVAGIHLPVPEYGAGALDLSGGGRIGVGCGIRAVYEEVLSSSRRIFGFAEEIVENYG